MANIGKVSGIDSKLGDTSRQANSNKKQERAKAADTQNFSDIYDIRRIGEVNQRATQFTLQEAQDANIKLREVIKGLESVSPELMVATTPSEAMIELSKMAKVFKN